MATNKRTGIKLPNWTETGSQLGYRVDPGPYVGVIKNNIDPTRSGRLQVFIPDFGGNENDIQSWRTVSYASPFYGSTFQPETTKDNEFTKVAHTYGMWAVPPDIGVEVLCIFAGGDPMRGYWFACVNSHLSHYMTPGLAASPEVDRSSIQNDKLKKGFVAESNLPVAEFNENDPDKLKANFIQSQKPVHEYQATVLVKQGLDKDRVRGAISSSSQRETPSQVFGISTPGRPLNDTADDINYFEKLQRGEIKESDYAVRARKGGHTFVMDDGDVAGNDQLIRLRTAGGHQLLMNDKENVFYVCNTNGTVWMEFSPAGQLHVYSYGGINIRSEGDLNIHSDKNIAMQGKSIQIKSETDLAVESNKISIKAIDKLTVWGGDVGVGSGSNIVAFANSKGQFIASGDLILNGSTVKINSGGGGSVTEPAAMKPFSQADADKNDETSVWSAKDGSLTTIAKIAPTHEPWTRKAGVVQGTNKGGESISTPVTPTKKAGQPQATTGTPMQAIECKPKDSTVKTGSGGILQDSSGNPVQQGAASNVDPGIAAALGQSVSKGLPKEWLGKSTAPNPASGVGPLSQYQMKCIMSQIAYTESGWKYDIVEVARGNYLGRYQLGAAALAQFGYIKNDYLKQYSTKAVNFDAAWTGKDNINSKQDYLNSPSVQESAMLQLVTANYNTLVRIGAIKSTDDICTVAGMITASHLLGAGGAKNWRNTGGGADANGTTGAMYFNRGRYAVDVLAAT